MERAFGIDVSHHHPVRDFAAVAGAGVSIFGAKATEGASYVDSTFIAHRDGARAQGFDLCIWYHFARSGGALKQAKHFLATVGDLRDNERLAVDVEVSKDGSVAGVEWLDVFLRALPQARRPLVYTSARIWRMLGSPEWPESIATDLWAPRYGTEEPRLPADERGFTVWPSWKIWQDSDVFTCPGVAGPCDHNVFNGDVDDLRRYAALPPPQSAAPT
jgi:lysozyme